MAGYIAVDLDGTLARYSGWNDGEIGEPIPLMVDRVKNWLAQGREVRIFTARVSGEDEPGRQVGYRELIQEWCLTHIGQILPVTCCKDYGMITLFDDRAVSVEPNTGRITTDNWQDLTPGSSHKGV